MNPDVAPMHRLSLCFKDAALETSYIEEQEQKSVRPRRMGALVAAACVAAVWGLAFLPIQRVPLDLDRVSVLSIAFLVGATLFYAFEGSRHFLRYRRALNLTFFLLISVVVIGVVSLMPPTSLAISGLALVIVHTFSLYGISRLRFPAATAGGWFTDLKGPGSIYWRCKNSTLTPLINFATKRRIPLSMRSIEWET